MRWTGNIACMGRGEFIQGFGGKSEGSRPLGRPRRRWRMLLKQILKNWDGEA
jgi:hypothetical protein